MGPYSAPYPYLVASLGSRIYYELPFRSEDAYSLVWVINRNTYLENFGKAVYNYCIHYYPILFFAHFCSFTRWFSHSLEISFKKNFPPLLLYIFTLNILTPIVLIFECTYVFICKFMINFYLHQT